MSGESGISTFFVDDNIVSWRGTITKSKYSVFEWTEYKHSFLFSNDYPFKPLEVKFEMGCFRPNIDVSEKVAMDYVIIWN